MSQYFLVLFSFFEVKIQYTCEYISQIEQVEHQINGQLIILPCFSIINLSAKHHLSHIHNFK